jgi:hypothetical protein
VCRPHVLPVTAHGVCLLLEKTGKSARPTLEKTGKSARPTAKRIENE